MGFEEPLRAKVAGRHSAVIADVKQASPPKGVLRDDFVPGDMAWSYAEHGAARLNWTVPYL